MNDHQLRCFVAAARYLNFTRAAQDLFLTQAAVTYQMNELEKTLGVKLFARTKEGLQLTAAGRSLQVSADSILTALADAEEKVRRAACGEGSALRIGCYGDVMHPLLPSILAAFRDRFPEVEVSLQQALARDLVEGLNRDDFDVVFMTGYGDYVASLDWLERVQLFEDIHVAVVPKDHPLASAESVTPEELAGVRKILLSERDLLAREDHIGDVGSNTEFLFDPQSVRVLVDAGYGVSICVRHVAQFYDPYSVCIPIAESSMPIYACWKKGTRSETAAALIDLAKSMVDDLLE
ncbi:LysR family transcriptional regulator [Adlercreutzia sp. R21]|uniref:LysR family transcriptional regulator n=1 Tax=Adlercreutzia wanghongyangiae TaxID=3111451 RepID=A0ABU6IGJ0_9ACTN|nr:LysR family transcriptional regulator [Adlercreutzia sp. R21]MEC4175468.1 LysR family transcriptional regulator [Adlercreutzia sp. R7]MEC4183321.1 LysR family transcriptional regulator [Adlercreutzia sp. R21]